ncbi:MULTISPECIES: hypothetical protein [Prauserella salsuginis group]|uniref:Lipoprotein n=2 Tax=Prauserella salsuginis group TaxID=2893672 RepID=A0A839XRV8_9PSEU|nr:MULTISPECIES: hypothetical protein [Prauserella salsuginis group]MBB3665461.1 hypothetical protein [Prauserella sediminis]
MTTRRSRTRRAAIGLGAALVALAGCTDADADGSARTSPVTATRAVHLDPFTPSGRPAPEFTVVDRAAAKCSASGVNLSDPDARRCMTTDGYFLYDPCFVRHRPRPDVALCVQNPTTSEAVRIRIVEDTPRPPGDVRPDRPWFLELADGRRCVPAPSPTEDDPPGRPTYTCGSDDHLYGLPDTTKHVWTITNRHGGADEPGPPRRVSIRTAWL